MNSISIKINGNEYDARFEPEENSEIFIDDKPFNVELLKKYSQNIFSFAVNQQLVQIALDFREHGSSYIIVDGFTHEIEIQDETRKLLKKFLNNPETGNASLHAKIKAPMPGMVVKILTEPGKIVNKGDKLIIIEAMKMENALKSPISGKITTVFAKENTSVEKDALLLEIEAII